MKISKLLVVVLSLGFMAVPAVAAVPVTSGLIGVHDAGAGWDGTNWSDQVTGDGYDAVGTLVGGVTHTAASGSDPAYFGFTNVNTDRIWFDTIPTALGTSDFTVQMWLNVSSAPQGGAHMGIIGTSNAAGMPAGFGAGQIRSGDVTDFGQIRPSILDGTDYHYHSTSTDAEAVLMDGTWRLLTITRNAAGPELGVWFDAALQASFGQTLSSGNMDMALGTVPMHINPGFVDLANGIGRFGSGDKFNKLLVYDRLLSPAEIAQNVAAGPNEVVPEPASLALLGIGAALVLLRRRRA